MSTQAAPPSPIHVARQKSVGIITLDRPEKANAYDTPMLQAFRQALQGLHADPAIHVLVIMARGKHFCAGADLDEMTTRGPIDALDLESAAVFQELATLPEITLAAIHGGALGGGLELALACDLRMASTSAFFALPEVTHGILPAAGGTYRLVELVGVARTKALVLGGQRVEARTALEWGLVTRLVPDRSLEQEAVAWAERIAGNAPLALRLAKQAVHTAAGAESARHVAQVSQALLYELARGGNVR